MTKAFKFMDGSGYDEEGNLVAAPPEKVTQIQPVIPTAANGFGTGVPYESDYDRAINERYKESQVIDRDGIRQQKVAQFQAEIDATNQIYSNLIAKANVEGEDRLGRNRAISARSGLIGSQRGEAQREGVLGYNRQIEADLVGQKQARIANIMTLAQDRADAEIVRREEAKRLGSDQYINYLGQAEQRKAQNAQAVMQSLLGQGLKLEDIPQSQLTDLSNNLRLTPQEFTSIYKAETAKAASANAAAERANYDKALETNLKYGIEGNYFVQGGLVRRSSNGEPLTEKQFFDETGFTSWDQVPEGFIDTSLSTPEDRELAFDQYKFINDQDLKEREFGFDQTKFGAEFGLKQEDSAFDRSYKNAQLDLEERKLTSDQEYKLASLDIDREKLTLNQQKALLDNTKLTGEQKKLNAIALSGINSLEIIKQGALDEDGSKNWGGLIKSKLGLNRTYNDAITNLSDVIGRMRSGGAITEDEEKRFRSLMPSIKDSANTVKTKLGRLETELEAISPDGGVTSPRIDSYKSEMDDSLGKE